MDYKRYKGLSRYQKNDNKERDVANKYIKLMAEQGASIEIIAKNVGCDSPDEIRDLYNRYKS